MDEQPYELKDVAEQFSRVEAQLHPGLVGHPLNEALARRRLLGDTIAEVNCKSVGRPMEQEMPDSVGSPVRRNSGDLSGYTTPSEAHSLTRGISWGAVCEQARVTVNGIRAAEPRRPCFSSLDDCTTASFETASRAGSYFRGGEEEEDEEEEEELAVVHAEEVAATHARLAGDLAGEDGDEVELPAPARGPVGAGTLGFQVHKAALASAYLQHEYWGRWHAWPDSRSLLPDACVGAMPCPHLGRVGPAGGCAATAMCRHLDLIDPFEKGPLARNDPARTGGGGGGGDGNGTAAAADEAERSIQLAYAGSIFLLENVYMNGRGQVFNATHFFWAWGCSARADFSYGPETRVTRFELIANAITYHSDNFFHTMMEILPDFLVLSPLLKQPRYKDMPIAFHKEQDSVGPSAAWLPLLGFRTGAMNIHRLGWGAELFFAERLLLPAHGFCGRPSGAVLGKLRAKYLGFPPAPPVPEPAWRRARGAGWAIVVSTRPRPPRNIVQHAAIVGALAAAYGAPRVVEFFGNLSVAGTRALFLRAALFVGPHGAGMTNLIFMPPGAAVLEVRPRDYKNNCYQHLSDRIGLPYYRVFGDGGFETPIDVDSAAVVATVERILPPGQVER